MAQSIMALGHYGVTVLGLVQLATAGKKSDCATSVELLVYWTMSL